LYLRKKSPVFPQKENFINKKKKKNIKLQLIQPKTKKKKKKSKKNWTFAESTAMQDMGYLV